MSEILVVPVCGAVGGGDREVDYRLLFEGESFTASVYGRRLAMGTKEGEPLQGILWAGWRR